MTPFITANNKAIATGPTVALVTPVTNCANSTDEAFKKINRVLNDLAGAGSLFMGAGYCVAMCDLLHTILLHHGIKSHIVEVTLTISYNQSQDDRSTLAIGFDNTTGSSSNSVETHVVLVTQTDKPFLIDPSISHKLPHGKGAVVAYCGLPVDKFALDFVDIEHDLRLTYKQKETQKVPSAHQTSILNRIYKDISIENKLKLLTKLITVALIVSALNFIRGSWDYYQTFVDTTNYWGPTHVKEIIERLDHLEKNQQNHK